MRRGPSVPCSSVFCRTRCSRIRSFSFTGISLPCEISRSVRDDYIDIIERMPIVACPKCGAKNRVEDRGTNVQPVCGRCGEKLLLTSEPRGPIEITDATFAATLQSAGDRPVLVDCWAAWCGPCRMVAPTIDQLAAESDGRWIIGKLDVDRN